MRPGRPSGGSAPQAGFLRPLHDELAEGLAPQEVQGGFVDGGPGAGPRLDLVWHRPPTRSCVGAEVDEYGDVVVFEQPADWPLSGRSARREHLFVRESHPPVPEWDEQQRELSSEAVRFLVERLRR